MSARFASPSPAAESARTTRTPSRRAATADVLRAKPRTFLPAADDPLQSLAIELTAPAQQPESATLTGHGKPVGGLPVFGARRAPARRAGYRTPPR